MKKKENIILTLILLLLIIIIVIIEVYKNSNKIKNTTNTNPIIVNDYSLFYTISNCVQRYINYQINNDVDSLDKVLNDKYKEDNIINKDNILNKLDNLQNKNYSFQARKMYYLENTDGYTYYIYGYLILDNYSDDTIKNDYYIIVNVDKEYSIFDIIPYNGELFKEAI